MTPPSLLLIESNSKVTMTPVAIQAELLANKAAAGKDPALTDYPQTYGSSPLLENTNNHHHHTTNQPNDNKNMTPTENTKDNHHHDALDLFDVDGASFWETLASFSMLFLWFQRSYFGVICVVRSLVLGHCLQLLFRNTLGNNNSSSSSSQYPCNSDPEDPPGHSHNHQGVRKYFYLLQSLLLGTATAGSATTNGCSHHHKQVNGAWPPPALVGLAILTILALVVHPDGMTWIVLRKIRDTFMAVLQSSTTCWAIMIRDYGVLGTVSASASITVVLIVAIAMHKTFLSNCCGNSEANVAAIKRRSGGALTEKKRRRRKGHRGRIKGTNSAGNPAPVLGAPRLPKVEEDKDGGGSRRNSASSELLKMIFEEDPKSTTVDMATKETADHHQEEEGASIMTSPSALESVVSEDCEAKGRTPVPSVCTVDTTSMSDDISCGSFSVRSVQPQTPVPVVRQTNSRANKGKGNAPTRGGNKQNNKTNRGQKQQQPQKATSNVNPRRVEAQKPTKAPAAPSDSGTSMRFDQFKKPNQKRNSGGKGNTVSTQNPRGRGGKNNRAAKNQKNQPTVQSPPPTTPKAPSLSMSSKTTASPSTVAKNNTAVPSGSPVSVSNLGSNPVNINSDSRLPPFSPYSQSLFSCEIGASGWSLPALPVVAQPKTLEAAKSPSLSPALSYQNNPFVAPYSQMPAEQRNTVQSEPSFGLWNSGQPSTPSTVASSVDLKVSMTTPKRPLRAPPGLPTPPGFEAHLAQPILSNSSSDRYATATTTIRTPEKPALVQPAFGSPSSSVGRPGSPLALSTGVRLGGTSTSTCNSLLGVQRNLLKENPFAEHPDDAECRIEAELQELGGRMIGSVLDF